MIPIEATLLRMYLNGNDRRHGKPLYRAVVETARSLHLAGASVFLVDLCYGAHRQIHDAKSDYSSFAIPVVLDFVDAAAKLDAFLVEVDAMVGEGLVVLRPVRVIRYAETTGTSEGEHVVAKVDGGRQTETGGLDTMKIEARCSRSPSTSAAPTPGTAGTSPRRSSRSAGTWEWPVRRRRSG